VKVIDESEGLKPEVLEQMKKELLLRRSKVLLDVEKELRAASSKSKGEMDTIFAEASELIACIDADSKRFYGSSAKVIGSAEALLLKLAREKEALQLKQELEQMGGSLVDAADEGDAKMVRELLAAGADANYTKDGDGRTALHKAARWGYLEIVQALVDAGADVQKRRMDGCTALIMAASNGHLEVVKALVSANADVNQANNRGQTPINKATDSNKAPVVEFLKSVGAR
jgi:ankyrin repeat protein